MKRKDKRQNLGRVILPTSHPNKPEQHEIDIAWILARHFQCTVEFLIPVDDYKRKTADIVMFGVEWEMKSPTGESKSTIGAQFRRASRQSGSIVLDSRRTKLKYEDIEKQVIIEAKQRTSIKRVILIDKLGKVVEIKK
jgi:hypothetical protein